jgi:hypothetical protein
MTHFKVCFCCVHLFSLQQAMLIALEGVYRRLRHGAFAVYVLTPDLYMEFFQLVTEKTPHNYKFRVYGGAPENSLHVALRRPSSAPLDMRRVNIFFA